LTFYCCSCCQHSEDSGRSGYF